MTLRHPSPCSREAIGERPLLFCTSSRFSGSFLATRSQPLVYPERFQRGTTKSFLCHTSENFTHNSFPCHTSKNTGLKVLCLPHIQKMAGVGGILLTRFPMRESVLSDRRESKDLSSRSEMNFYPERASRLKDLKARPINIPVTIHPSLRETEIRLRQSRCCFLTGHWPRVTKHRLFRRSQ
jgi:hypothetical protein